MDNQAMSLAMVATVLGKTVEEILVHISTGKLQATPQGSELCVTAQSLSAFLGGNGADSSGKLSMQKTKEAKVTTEKDNRVRVQFTFKSKPNSTKKGDVERFTKYFNPKTNKNAVADAHALKNKLDEWYAQGVIKTADDVCKLLNGTPVAVPVVQTTPVSVVTSAPVQNDIAMYEGVPINKDTDFFTYGRYFIDDINKSSKASKTNYRGHLNRLEHFGFLQVSISEVQASHGDDALEWVAEFGSGAEYAKPEVPAKPVTLRRKVAKPAIPAVPRKNGTKASCATVDGYIKTLGMIVRQAVKDKLLDENVFRALEIPDTALDEGEKEVIPPHIWEVFLESAKSNHMLYTYILIMKSLGTRPSEARALSWKNINLSTGVIHVKQTVEAGEEGVKGLAVTKENRLKRKRGKKLLLRKGLLLPDALAVLREYKRKQTAELGECEFVFTVNGDIIKKKYFSIPISDLQDQLISEGKMNEDERFIAYNIRHTVITDWLILGMNPLEVSKMVGTSLKMIEEHYDHSDCDNAIEKLVKLSAKPDVLTA